MLGASASGTKAEHTFVVPVFGRSPYLEACLASLRDQSRRSRIVVSTSTPFPGIDALAADHGAETFVHAPNRGIGADWNAALAQSRTEWTTIAHQDDVYRCEYAERVVAAGCRVPGALIVFCDYAELGSDGIRARASLPSIKRALLELAFLWRDSVSLAGAKRRALRFGNPIPCPAVAYHREALRGFRFREDLRVNLDWAAWLELAARPGAFVWLRQVLMEYRVHASSETTAGLGDGTRQREDLEILSSLWPRPIARLIRASFRPAYAGRL